MPDTFALLSVNVARPRPIGILHGEPVISGIDKKPVAADTVMVRVANIEGDGQADLSVHGGTDKAVYAYSAENWSWWTREQALPCEPATFGENLTLRIGLENQVAIGDRFRWGEALLEVSQPRAPCFKLAMHTKREDVPQLMTRSARCGWYLRVIEEGRATVAAGLVRVFESGGPSVRDAFVAALHPEGRDIRLRVLDAPALAENWRLAIARKMRA
jgi:MOSC domain-containing protein YiiM